MNLPLEYTKLADFFDALGASSPNSVNRLIGKILRKNRVKTVLDLTCGTGSQILWLAKQQFKVTGSDLNRTLLKIARNKSRKENLKMNLLQGDMRTLQVGQFDAVVTIFNAVGHLSKKDFAKTMRNVHKNLKRGGIYIFDIFNLNSMSGKVIENLKVNQTKIVNGIKIFHTQYSKLNKKRGRLTSYDQFTIQEKSKKIKIYKSNFSLQIYTAKELRDMLIKNGFKVLDQCGIDGAKFSEKNTRQILTVAKKW